MPKLRKYMILRDYQLETIEKARESIRSGNKRIIIQANCGAGKTIIAASIISSALDKGKKTLFLVHFRQLAYQAMERFSDFGLSNEVGFIMAGEKSDLDRPIQIASIQSYARRINFDAFGYNKWFSDADIVIYDECHSSVARTRKAILDIYKDSSIIIGLSATPCRADSKPLGVIYEDIVSCSSIKELTELKYLVPVRYFGASHSPDLENIPIVAGDYNKKELSKRVNKPKLIGDILENWLRIAGDRQTVIFATNVKHSISIKEVFEKNGINIEHVDAKTPQEEREDILDRFKNGDIQVVTNVGVFSEGADFPWARSVILARPSKSYARFIQMAGRGLRPYENKDDVILIDHAKLIETHGFLEDEIEWTLDGKDVAWKKPKKTKKDPKPCKCRVCNEVFVGLKVCPRCNTKLKKFGKKIETVDAELVELKGAKKRNRDYDWDDKRKLMGALRFHAAVKGYKDGWALHSYRDYFGCWPNDKRVKHVSAIEPQGNIKNLLTHILIKKAKQYKKSSQGAR